MAGESGYTFIKDLRPGLKNLNVMFIVLEIGKPNRTKDGHDVRTCKIADKTGSINISIWDEAGSLLQTGDICKVTKGYASMWKGCLTLYTGKGGDIHKIGEFCMQFTEVPNMSEPSAELLQQKPDNQKSNSQRKSPTDGPEGNQGGNNDQHGSQMNPRPPLLQGPNGHPANYGGPRYMRPPSRGGPPGGMMGHQGRGRGGRR